jgi:hypothetical protein
LSNSLFQAADKWLRLLQVNHPDFLFFCRSWYRDMTVTTPLQLLYKWSLVLHWYMHTPDMWVNLWRPLW